MLKRIQVILIIFFWLKLKICKEINRRLLKEIGGKYFKENGIDMIV